MIITRRDCHTPTQWLKNRETTGSLCSLVEAQAFSLLQGCRESDLYVSGVSRDVWAARSPCSIHHGKAADGMGRAAPTQTQRDLQPAWWSGEKEPKVRFGPNCQVSSEGIELGCMLCDTLSGRRE